MHRKKLVQILGMKPPERHAYFVRKVADFEEVWGLEREGWAMAADESGRRAMPIWPEAELAATCATGAWSGFSPKRIELRSFLEKWLVGMEKDGILAAVCPTPEDKGVLLEPRELADQIQAELEQYE